MADEDGGAAARRQARRRWPARLTSAARGVERYPNEVALPVGEAGQTKAGVILCHQVRTISLLRVPGVPSPVGYLGDPSLREHVRVALARHLGLDIPAGLDGATGTRAFKP